MAGLLDDEIERLGNNFWNYVEPTQKAQIVGVIGEDRFIISFHDIDINNMKARVLKPCYKDVAEVTCDNGYCTLHVEMSKEIDLSPGDNVLVAFKRGQISDPVIVGKY